MNIGTSPKTGIFFRSAIYLLLIVAQLSAFAQQKKYAIDVSKATKEIKEGQLQLGGTDQNGNTIAVNNYYISYSQKPIIPVTGEFHFSRYPEKYWDESIKKMKAGGITMVATYVFWNIHEEKEGVFNWNGNRNLRKFLQLCKTNEMHVVIRIGPFCHGEIRSGGMPDWLMAKPFAVRSNDAGYLACVDKLYNEIGKQMNGLFFKEGGPVIATQLENEYQHSASPWGITYPGAPYDWTASARDKAVTHQGVAVSDVKNPYADLGKDHMKVLKSLAIKNGINTPLYTATGWGNAAIVDNESIPVTAAYAYPTWTEKADISPFYLFKDMTKNPDYAPISYDSQQYPAFAAELGSGIMSTYVRRPIVPAESMDALINRCLGSAANGLGYYMYHGGSTPKGEFFFSDEAYGYPKISYDFQAPIGEYGQVRPAFHRLKLIHFFLKDFGELLAPMALTLPAGSEKLKPEDLNTLRYSVRSNGKSGFLFINNFQDDAKLTDKTGLTVNIKTIGETISFPIGIKSGENAIYPFNLNLSGINLKYATAQLLAKVGNAANQKYVFFNVEGEQPVFIFSKTKGLKISNLFACTVSQTPTEWRVSPDPKMSAEFVLDANGKKTSVLTVSKAEALKAYLIQNNGEQVLAFSEALILQDKKALQFLSMGKADFNFSIYPKTSVLPTIDSKFTKVKDASPMDQYHVSLPAIKTELIQNLTGEDKVQVKLPTLPKDLNDIFLGVDYLGDVGLAFLDNRLVADDFYKGLTWNIGLKQFLDQAKEKELQFYFRPIYPTASYLVDLQPSAKPSFKEGSKLVDIKKMSLTPEYKFTINIK
ncbi:MAG: glycosyl hydrolase family 35 [Pedobacter sp.]|nr:MAG: glycosyl hydrolase family 35 [Pedobacter sp.]